MTTTNTISVYSSSELSKAISELTASGGGTILVHDAGDAYDVSKYMAGCEEGTINIVAADPENPPQFSSVKLVSSQNITFEGLSFDSSENTDTKQTDLTILYSDNISFLNNEFVSYSNGYNAGDGSTLVGHTLSDIKDSDGLVFSGNTVSGYNQGLTIANATGTTITDNEFTKMTADGIRLSGIQDTLIEGNVFHDFYGSAHDVNHDDMIQVWSAPYNTQNTENLVIRDNVFNSGDGAATQTVFINNEMFKYNGVYYQNIVIDGNTIYNGHTHGVTLNSSEGVVVSDNTLLWNSNSTMSTTASADGVSSLPRINFINSTGDVTGNITAGITGDGATLSGNIIVDYTNPSSPNYVGNHLVNWTGGTDIDLRDLMLVEDSLWNGTGSAAIQWGVSEGDLTAVISQRIAADDASLVTYDGGYSFGPDGFLDPASATYTWTFSDGVVLRGKTVTRDFDSAGDYGVELSVTTGGETATLLRTTTVEDMTLLAMSFEAGVQDDSGYASDVWLEGDTTAVVGETGTGFHLDGINEIHVARETAQLKNLMNFSLSLSLARDEDGASGTFVHIHAGMNIKVMEDGSLYARIDTSDGTFIATTAAGMLSDTDWHRVAISYDGTMGGGLQVYIDGQLEASETGATGALKSGGTWDLVFGQTWGDGLQARLDNVVLSGEAFDGAKAAADFLKATTGTVITEPEETVDGAVETPPVTEPEDVASEDAARVPDTGSSEEVVVSEPVSDVEAPSEDVDGAGTGGSLGSTFATLLKLDFDASAEDTSVYGSLLQTTGGSGLTADGGFHLSKWNDLVLDGSNGQLQGLGDVTVALDLQRDAGGNAGTILHQHGALYVQITKKGNFRVSIHTSDGQFEAVSEGRELSNTDLHRLMFSYGGESGGGLKLFIDGELVAENSSATGTLNSTGKYDLVLGETWSYSAQATVDDLIIVEGVGDTDAAAQDHQAFLSGQDTPLPGLIGAEGDTSEAYDLSGVDLTPKILTMSTLLKFDFEDMTDQSLFGSVAWTEGASGEAVGRYGDGFHLDGENEFHIDNASSQLRNLDAFTISMSLQRDLGGESGTFLHMHGELRAEITADGRVSFALVSDEGRFSVESAARLISDSDWHRLMITYDGENGGGLQLYVDGVLEASDSAAFGTVNTLGRHDLVLGHTWNEGLEGTIDDLIITDHVTDSDEAWEDNLTSMVDGGFAMFQPDAWLADSLVSGLM